VKIEFWNIYNYFRGEFDENFNNTLLIRNVGFAFIMFLYHCAQTIDPITHINHKITKLIIT